MELDVDVVGAYFGDGALYERAQVLHKVEELLAHRLGRARSHLNVRAAAVLQADQTLQLGAGAHQPRAVPRLVQLHVDQGAVHVCRAAGQRWVIAI